MRPGCTLVEARSLANDLFGVDGDIRELASYSDQNFLVGQEYVLKIANSAEPESVLQFQQQALQHLHQVDPALNTPQVIPLKEGSTLGVWEGAHQVWMVNYLKGQFVSDLDRYTDGLLFDIGAYMGRLDVSLESFEHGAMQRDLQWDLRHASRLAAFLRDMADSAQRQLVEYFLHRFETDVVPRFPELRISVIHNDANDNNILVNTGGDHVIGIIDFGDMVQTYTICELAIAIAYMILGKEDPLPVAETIIRGYHYVYPLKATEVDVLFYLICIRLCTSVCMSARERKKAPDNDYLAISEAPAWDALKRLAEIDPTQARNAFHGAAR